MHIIVSDGLESLIHQCNLTPARGECFIRLHVSVNKKMISQSILLTQKETHTQKRVKNHLKNHHLPETISPGIYIRYNTGLLINI